ncbi:MAG TPA: PKD domain-containing protein [Baekduia sp.]
MPSTRRGARRHRLGALAAAAVATATLAVLVPAGEASAQGWFDGPAFAGPHDLSTVFAEAPDGSVTTVWTGTEIDLQHAAPDGTVGPVEQIADDATNLPVLAVGRSGAGAVVWSVPHAFGTTVPLKVTLVRADGTPGRTDQVGPIDSSTPVVAVDAAGNAIVVWSAPGAGGAGTVVTAARVAPGGIVTPIPLAGASSTPGDSPQVAVAPDGTAWIGWIDPNGNPNPTERVERVAPDGTPGPDAAVSDPAANVFSPVLVAGATGGVAMWSRGASASQGLRGVRLATTGADVATGDPLPLDAIDPADDRTVHPVVPAIGPDGVISVLWTEDSGTSSTSVILSRIGADGALAPSQTLATASDTAVTVWPQLAATSDGTLLAEWIDMPSDTQSATSATVRASHIGADGTIAPATTAGTLTFPTPLGIFAGAFAQPFADTADGGLVKLVSIDGITATVSLRRLDAVGPAVRADVPATAVAGTPIAMSATASDTSGATVAWDFGDGGAASGGSVQHTYAAPGTHAVTVTATDGVENETVVRRQITVTAPAGPGPVVTPGPPPHDGGGHPVVPAPVKKAAAALKVAKATRTGAKVTVSGTIAKAASGKITITYAAKVGRKTVTKRATARIAKGRWSASFKLTGRLASKAAAGHATITITYAGNAHTAKATTAKHAVRTTAPAHRAPAKRKG